MNNTKIFFWNCGLAYSESIEPPQESIEKVLEIVKYIMNEKECDILILCEINTYTYSFFKKKLSSYVLNTFTNKSSKNSNFDIMTISNNNISIEDVYYIKQNNLTEEQIKVEEEQNYLPKKGRTMKVGIDITIKIKNINNSLNLIASHWSSHMNGFSEENREESGESLKFYVKKLIDEKKQVILIGDYNDNPQSISIFKKLDATNNRHYASIDIKRIYNPSFLFYAPHKLYYTGEEKHFHGTWLSKDNNKRKNNKTSCQVLDQVMVTSSFIKNGPWYLDEEGTKVISDEKIMDTLYGGEIDHLPIMVRVSHLIQIGDN